MIKQINILDRELAEKVLILQKRAYRIEAEIIGTVEIPPLKENLEELMFCGEKFLGFFSENKLLAVVSYKMTESLVDIHRVMVDTGHVRKGIASKLLKFLEESFGSHREIIVCTASENRAAIFLYEKLGFVKIAEKLTEEGIILVKFKKILGTSN